MCWLSLWKAINYWGEYKKLTKQSSTSVKSPKSVVLKVRPRWAASAPLGLLLTMHILRPHPRPIESETLGTGPSNLCLASPLDDSLVIQPVKNPPEMQETQIWSLGWEDPLEKEMATHFSSLAWNIPWTEKPGRLPSTYQASQSMGSQRVGHDWMTSLSLSGR